MDSRAPVRPLRPQTRRSSALVVALDDRRSAGAVCIAYRFASPTDLLARGPTRHDVPATNPGHSKGFP
jgi:hypothetical protein